MFIAAVFISVPFRQSYTTNSMTRISKRKMLKMLVTSLVLFLKSSVEVEAAVLCPPVEAISPCLCYQNTTTTTTLNCQSLNLTDSQASDILDAYLSTPDVSPVGVLYLNGIRLLTHIPIQINSFTPLSEAFLSYNSFTSIESGLFNLKDAANPLASLYLNSNQLTTIAPGAFKGIHFLLSLIAIKIE